MVSEDEWALVAHDLGTSVEDIHARIADLDARDAGDSLARFHDLDPFYFDRDLDPITLGQWAFLHESRSYRIIAETILPNRIWVATIWTGTNDEMTDPPTVMRTGVFNLAGSGPLGDPINEYLHANLTDALTAHPRIVRSHAT